MKYPGVICDYCGTQGANHTEPIKIGEDTHVAYLSDEALNTMMQLGGQVRNGKEGAEEALASFWSRVHENILKRTSP